MTPGEAALLPPPPLCLRSHVASGRGSQTTVEKSRSLTLVAKPRERGSSSVWRGFNPGKLNLGARTCHSSPKIGICGQSCHVQLLPSWVFWGGNPHRQPWLGDGLWHVLAQGRNRFIKSNAARSLLLSCPNPISVLGEALRG